MKSLIVVVFALVAAGCATNPYGQFYTGNTTGTGSVGEPSLIKPVESPKAIKGTNVLEDGKKMLRDGYGLIGMSRFNTGPVSDDLAVEHAKKVSAEMVLLYSSYTGTESGYVPVDMYGTGTPSYMPYHRRRYDYVATFWARIRPPIFGAHLRDLTEEQRRTIESNTGVAVYVVVRGTPAFRSDVLEGDIIKQVDGQAVTDFKHFGQVLAANAGKEVKITIIRGSRTLAKHIRLNEQAKPEPAKSDGGR